MFGMTQSATRAPLGNLSGGRSMMANIRSGRARAGSGTSVRGCASLGAKIVLWRPCGGLLNVVGETARHGGLLGWLILIICGRLAIRRANIAMATARAGTAALNERCCVRGAERGVRWGGSIDPDPVVVVIPHRHGKTEAARRIKAGLEDVRARYAAKLKVAEEKWEGDRLTFRAAVLGQTVVGTINVADDNARAEVKLTWFWSHMLKPAEDIIRQEGTQMLS